jgi:hypothetical protein
LNEKWKNIVITSAVGAIGLTPVADFVEYIQVDKEMPKYCSIYAPSDKQNDLYKVLFQQPQISSGTATTNVVLNI